MHQALYRKWRPATFDEVVGQEHITTTLKNEIAASKPAHAYLFMGSRGTGKTTCSRIVAKAVNCLAPREGNPCGACDSCRGIDNGSLVDVVEIDAASNNGVDNIRELREEAAFLPNAARFRVYIIDEVHMLSTGAFNALLKILEEPPAHVVFVLATTEAHKVPATILSRCQRFDFRRIDSAVIAHQLERIAGEEEFSLDHDAALLLARIADGGMRDALSLLELCASFGSIISVETVSKATGLVSQDYLFELCDAVLDRDTGAFLELVGRLGQSYVEYDRLCEQLLTHYRNLMVAKSSGDPADLIVCLPEVLEQYKAQAARCPMSGILYALTVLQETLSAMTRTTHRRTELEMAAVRLCDATLELSPEGLAERIGQLEARLAGGVMPAAPATAPAQSAKRRSAAKVQPDESVAGPDAQAQPAPAAPAGMEAEEAVSFEQWPQVLICLAKLNPPLNGFLGGSGAFIQGGRVLIDSRNDMFLKLVRESEQARSDLKKAIFQVTGRSYGIGPYEGDKPAREKNGPDPLDAVLEQAKNAGVPVEIE